VEEIEARHRHIEVDRRRVHGRLADRQAVEFRRGFEERAAREQDPRGGGDGVTHDLLHFSLLANWVFESKNGYTVKIARNGCFAKQKCEKKRGRRVFSPQALTRPGKMLLYVPATFKFRRKTMLIPGLVTISFRKRSAEELIADCVKLGLRTLEWGGDVHVPHGDLARAREVAAATKKAGLTVSCYGSYFRAGVPDQPDFAGIVGCAEILGAPTIRVWARRENITPRTAVIRCRRVLCGPLPLWATRTAARPRCSTS